MNTNVLSLVGQLSDQQLVMQLKLLAQREQEATAALIAHLAVLDERGLYLAEGCSSMFTYCLQVLHLSEHAAYGRIEAARAARKYPIILELLGNGSVNLTTVTLLAPHLTAENHIDLFEAAKHQRKRQVEELVAALRPQPPVPSSIRRLPAPSLASAKAPVPDAEAGCQPLDPAVDSSDAARFVSGSLLSSPPSSAACRAVVEPLAPARYKVQFTASAETHAKPLEAQDLLRSQIPDGDIGEIIDRALTALLRNLANQKFAATDRPRKGVNLPRETVAEERRERTAERPGGSCWTVTRSRHIPAEVRRTVWKRDGGRCAFVARSGRRCTARAFLEFHHIVPHSAGGEATVENIELRCRGHNGYEAEIYFGRRKQAGPKSGADRGDVLSAGNFLELLSIGVENLCGHPSLR